MHILDLPDDVLIHIFKQGCVLRPVERKYTKGPIRNPFASLFAQVCQRWLEITKSEAHNCETRFWILTVESDDTANQSVANSLLTPDLDLGELHVSLILSHSRTQFNSIGIDDDSDDGKDLELKTRALAFDEAAKHRVKEALETSLRLLPYTEQIRTLFLRAPSACFIHFVPSFIALLTCRDPRRLETLHFHQVEHLDGDMTNSDTHQLDLSFYNSVLDSYNSSQHDGDPSEYRTNSLDLTPFKSLTELKLWRVADLPKSFPASLRDVAFINREAGSSIQWSSLSSLLTTAKLLSQLEVLVHSIAGIPIQTGVQSTCHHLDSATIYILSAEEISVPYIFYSFAFPKLRRLRLGGFDRKGVMSCQVLGRHDLGSLQTLSLKDLTTKTSLDFLHAFSMPKLHHISLSEASLKAGAEEEIVLDVPGNLPSHRCSDITSTTGGFLMHELSMLSHDTEEVSLQGPSYLSNSFPIANPTFQSPTVTSLKIVTWWAFEDIAQPLPLFDLPNLTTLDLTGSYGDDLRVMESNAPKVFTHATLSTVGILIMKDDQLISYGSAALQCVHRVRELRVRSHDLSYTHHDQLISIISSGESLQRIRLEVKTLHLQLNRKWSVPYDEVKADSEDLEPLRTYLGGRNPAVELVVEIQEMERYFH